MSVMIYNVRQATSTDVNILVEHRELMFREMGWHCDADMAVHYGRWLVDAIPATTYFGIVATPEEPLNS